MKQKTFWLLTTCTLLTVAACQRREASVDYYQLPAFTDQGVNAVVEIPAGTNHKIEFDLQSGAFQADSLRGGGRVIDFLPYPGNYGFIPSTYLDPRQGGDGDPLDVLVIGESRPTGAVLQVRPIGALRLSDEGEIDTKIIAVPADSSKRVIQANNFQEFLIEYDAARRIIEEWFISYKGMGATELLGWEDESFALEEIRKWTTTN